VVKSIICFVFGLKPTLEGLRIDPCLPPKWKECSIKKKFRGVTYDIHYHNVGEIKKILADGKEIEGDLLPMGETGSTVSVDVYL
jgi:cellobiose phosphorylase